MAASRGHAACKARQRPSKAGSAAFAWARLFQARALLLIALAAAVQLAGAADAVPTAADPALEARVHAIAVELRCLVCQNQTVAESTAPLAVDLKDQVRQQLRAGKSEAAILQFMTERYGDFVLYRPPLKASTLLLWGGPALILLGGLALFWATLRQRARAAPLATPTAKERDRAAGLLQADDAA